jgi:uncharacterized protein DUF1573
MKRLFATSWFPFLAVALSGVTAGTASYFTSCGQDSISGIEFSCGPFLEAGMLTPGHHDVSFSVRNRDLYPLRIREVKTTCGCLSVTYPRDPILPHDTGNCTARVLAVSNERRIVAVTFSCESHNTLMNSALLVRVGGKPEQQLRFDSASYSRAGTHVGDRESISISSSFECDESMRSQVPRFKWSVSPASELAIECEGWRSTASGFVFTAKVHSRPLRNGEFMRGVVRFDLESPDTRHAVASLSISAEQAVRFDPPHVLIGKQPHSGEVVAEIRCMSKDQATLVGVEGPDWLDSRVTTDAAGATTELVLTCRASPEKRVDLVHLRCKWHPRTGTDFFAAPDVMLDY